ncbi:MAG: glycosyltransferase family 4 protein, partial [Planctomycetota bacterium]|nr:glycosyltransferase family 4 protein [Planctomycetota bacterium]
SGLRVALITRRFWPLMEDIERTLARLATGLRRRGAEVTILTCRGSADWPERVDYQGTPVFRLPHPHRERWRTLCYLLAVDRWLRQHHEAIDVACVSQLRSDAYAVLRAGQRIGVPVVLRAESAGPQGDCQWQQRARFGGRVRRRCHAADAIVAPDAMIADELVQAGYADSRIARIGNGIAPLPQQTRGNRGLARTALADANPDLSVAAEAPVVVYAGRLSEAAEVRRLLQAWRTAVRCWPAGKLWLVGAGRGSDQLRDDIVAFELQHHVVLPGVFEDLGEVLHAANLYVDPGEDASLPSPLLEALAAGVPVLAMQTREPLLQAGCLTAAAWVPRKGAAFGEALLRMLAAPPAHDLLAETRAQVLRHFSLNRMLDEHLRLFERLVREKTHRG